MYYSRTFLFFHSSDIGDTSFQWWNNTKKCPHKSIKNATNMQTIQRQQAYKVRCQGYTNCSSLLSRKMDWLAITVGEPPGNTLTFLLASVLHLIIRYTKKEFDGICLKIYCVDPDYSCDAICWCQKFLATLQKFIVCARKQTTLASNKMLLFKLFNTLSVLPVFFHK